jgi:trimeric autotransporter adhesin
MDLRQTGALFRGVKVGVAKSRCKFHALAICAAFMTVAATGWGQLTEGFESGLPTSYVTTTSYTLGSGSWTGQASGVIRDNTQVRSGSFSCQLRSQTGAQITTPILNNGVGTITVWAVASSGTGGLQVQTSTDGSTFTQVGSTAQPTQTYTQYTFTVNNAAVRYVRFLRTAQTMRIDDISITAPPPTITGAATAIAFSTTYGTASAAQTFSVSGSNLTANLVATAPTGFEVSSDGTTYGSTATFTPTSGSASGSLRIRLKADAAVTGSYNSQNIVLSSTGATNVNITTASNGNSVTAKGLTITGLSAANKSWDGNTTVSVTGTPAYSGLVNGDSFSVTGTVTWAFPDANVGTGKTLTRTGSFSAPSADYSVTQPTLTANIVAVVPSAPTIGTITPGDGQLSVAFTAPTSSGGVSITNYKYSIDGGALVSVGSTSSPFIITGLTNGQSYAVRLYAVNTAGDSVPSLAVNSTPLAPSSPTITLAPATFAGVLSTIYGSASAEKSFTVSGSALTGDLAVTAPPGMEVALSGGSFGASVALPMIGDSVSTTTVRVRLAASASVMGSYNNVAIPVTGGGASDASVLTTSTGNQVLPKALTISGLTASDRAYTGLADATVTGTPVLTTGQVVGSDDVSLSGTASYSFSTATVGTSKPITTSGLSLSGASSANYSLTLPSLSANITQAPVTITGLTAANKNYDAGTTVSVTGTVAFSGLVNSESFTPSGSVTWAFADATVGTNKTLVRTGSYSAPSSNYSLTQPSLTANISAVVPAAPTGIVITKAVVSGQLSVAFVAPTNDGGSPITNYKYSTNAGTTWTAVSPAATTSPIVISGLVNGTSYNVQIRAVNVAGDGAATATTAATPAVPPIWTNPITDSNPSDSNPYTTGDVKNSNVTVSGISRGSGITASSAGNRFSASGWNSTSLDANDYFQFTITPVGGYQVSLTSFVYTSQASNTTGMSVAVRSSTDGYLNNIGAATITGTTIDLSGASFQNISSPITFRLYAWGAAASTTTFSVNDFAFNGTVSVIPTITINGNTSGSATAFTTTFGTPGTAQTFTIAGSNLTGNITATAPTGFEVSNDGATYGSTATFTQTGGAASGTLSVRLAATANVSGSYNSQSITLASTGATTRNITTASTGNSVSKATPTISVVPTASAITYGQTLASSNLTGGTASTSGTYAFTTTSTAPSAGTANQAVTFTPADAANYNTASTTASVVVNTKAITVTADAKSKAYGATDPALTYQVTTGALVVGDSLTGGLSRAAGENVGTYAISSTLANANYDVTFVPASLTVTAATLVSGDITMTPAGDGSYTASATGGASFTYSYAGRSANGITTSYSSATAPTAAGFYTVTATATGNYSGSNTADYFVAGPVAVADSRTKSAGNAAQLIPISEILANDRRITSTGTVETTGLTVTEVRAGAGSAARIVNFFVQFTPSIEPTDTFTYTVTDGAKTATATVTVTTETQAPEFRLQIVKVGTATFAGGNTTVTHDFIGVPSQTYLVEYATDLNGAWTSAGNQSTGATGSFSVTFTKSGDVAADWNAHMFFRARLLP